MDGLKNKETDNAVRIDVEQPDGADIVRDEVWLICAVAKWVVLAIVTGLAVGLVAGGFLLALRWSMDKAASLGRLHYLLLFPGLIVSYFLVRLLAPQSAGHGTEAVIDAIHNKRRTLIDVKAVPVKIAATIVTISSGGSVGIEGPCAQIGSGVSYVIGKIFNLDESDLKKVIICGIAAGFCAVFSTPVTGAIFAVEVLFVGQIFYDVLFPSLISGIVGYFTAAAMGAGHGVNIAVAVPELGPWALAASLLGFNTAHYRNLSLAISGFYCGVSGALIAGYMSFIQPIMFDMAKSTELVSIVVFGGLGSMSGCLLGTTILTLVTELFRPISQYRMLIYGLVLVLVMVLRPEGIMGTNELTPAYLKKLFSRKKTGTAEEGAR